jgi:hypothetical protein
MENQPVKLTCEIELQPGESLTLPSELIAAVGAGHWLITIQPVPISSLSPMRNHTAFLKSFSPGDEGLYNDYIR